MKAASFTRPTWVEINLKALRHNLKLVQRRVGKQASILAVVKADAYGHGATGISQALSGMGVKKFGVATLEEAEALRRQGVKGEILLLGPMDPCWLKTAARLKVGVTVWGRKYLNLAGQTAPGLRVHLKVDTGMNRLGFATEEARGALKDILNRRWKHLDLAGAYTHFASSDAPSAAFTMEQLKRFLNLPWPKGLPLHACNSAALLRFPQAWLNMVRPGMLLYGGLDKNVHPLARQQMPVLSLRTRVVSLKKIRPGEGVSYGRTFVARRPTSVAVLAAGYADGVPRLLSNRGEVLLKGRRCPIIGRVCMDLLMADVTGLKGIQAGEEAVLLGRQGGQEISASDWARLCGTISYEILCGISDRVPRVFF
jgi:alanine racemase